MKIISLWQPWASLIACGLKEYETRHWFTSYRGPLLIHAAKRKMLSEDRYLWNDLALQHPIPLGTVDELPLGAVVAIADLTACPQMTWLPAVNPPWLQISLNTTWSGLTAQELRVGNWEEGRYAWKLENVCKLPEPISLRGQQGLWPAEDWLIEKVKGAIAPQQQFG